LRPHVEGVERRLLLTTYVVDSTSDTPVAGHLTLREAITDTNAHPGPNSISFNLPAANVPGVVDYDSLFQNWIFQPATPLPTITNELFVDGYSQNVPGPQAGTSEVQSLSITGAPAAGTFTLTFEGQTTAPLPSDASAGLIQSALQALSTIGAGNVVTSGGPLPNNPVTLTFQGSLADKPLPLVTANGASLPPGSTVTTVTTTQGVQPGAFSTPNFIPSKGQTGAVVHVVLDGSKSAGAAGLTIATSYCEIRGLVIDGFGVGVHIVGPNAQGNLIQGNFIGKYIGYAITGGTELLGTGNAQEGVLIESPTNNTVGGPVPEDLNSIMGNGLQGIVLATGAEGCQVVNNDIGVAQVTDLSGVPTFYVAGNGKEGILVESSSNAIGWSRPGSGNIIAANGSAAIRVVGVLATSNRIEGNDIGGSPPGLPINGGGVFGNNGDGIAIEDAPHTQIGAGSDATRNVITGNLGAGIRVTGTTAVGTIIEGNFIGTQPYTDLDNVTSRRAQPNALEGVALFTENNTVGGTAAGAGNVISGNLRGVLLSGAGASGNLVAGNFIGTDVNGIDDLGNAQEGVRIDGAANNTIGGTSPPTGTTPSGVLGTLNVISGNNVGVLVIGTSATGNLIEGNYIGTDIHGSAAISNAQEGVRIDGALNNTVGGAIAGASNVISGNHWGLTITGGTATGNVVQSNLVGTDPSATLNVNNEVDGILVTSSAADNAIGGLAPGAGNIVAFNVIDGVRIETAGSIHNAILSDRIFSNGGLGIDLVKPPVGPGGPNNLQPAPVLTLLASTPEGAVVSGSLTAAANTLFRIQFFVDAPGDVLHDGQLVGATTVTTDGQGHGTFTASIPAPLPQGAGVRATATDPQGDTSEFSAPIHEAIGTVQFATANLTVNAGAPSATLAVTRTGGSGGQFQVNFATQDGTAIAGTDYQSTTGTLTFGVGVNSETITVPLLQDAIFNPLRTFAVVLSQASGPIVLGSPSSATISVQNLNAPGALSFSMSTYTASALDGQAAITVVRSGTGGSVTIAYATGGGTAQPGIEYLPVSGTLAFQPGQSSASFLVPILDATGVGTTTTVGLSLSSPTGGATLGSPSAATLNITPDLRNRSGPTVQNIQLLGSSRGATGILITFSEPLDAASAQNLLNYGYSVHTAGRDHRFGTRDDLIVGLISAVYDAATESVTLTLAKPMHPGVPFQLSINPTTGFVGGGGVSDTYGTPLDAAGNGVPGGTYQTVLIFRGQGSAPAASAHRRFPAYLNHGALRRSVAGTHRGPRR
jgi:titin